MQPFSLRAIQTTSHPSPLTFTQSLRYSSRTFNREYIQPFRHTLIQSLKPCDIHPDSQLIHPSSLTLEPFRQPFLQSSRDSFTSKRSLSHPGSLPFRPSAKQSSRLRAIQPALHPSSRLSILRKLEKVQRRGKALL